MRHFILTAAILFGLMAVPATFDTAVPAGTVVAAADAVPQNAPTIDVDINKGGGRAWYANPVWMAIGGLALVIVVLLIVMAAKGGGGGTTVVRG